MRRAANPVPQGWEFWEHVQSAADVAKDKRRERPPTDLFCFARELMRFPLEDQWLDDPESMAELIEAIYLQTLPGVSERDSDPDRTFWGLHFPQSGGREEFIAIWLAMRYPTGSDPLKLAVEDATQAPVRLQGSTSRVYRAVISIAYHLQKRAGNRDIVLPQVRIARELNVSQRTVSSYIAVAIDRGLLIPKSSYDYANKRAKRYRFRLSRFNYRGKERADRSLY
jgi:hypothetical protein